MSRSQEPIRPRNGHTLVVGVVARISGGKNQKELSLDDQVDHAKQVVAELYDGPVEYRVVATTGKGERLDRPELAEIEAMLRSGELDLLIAEDIGRIVRGAEASWLCGIAVDHGTRVIAPNDCIDTAEDAWEQDAISACRDHVGHNSHGSKRLKQKLMNRFKHGRGAAARPVYGYLVPEGAKSYDEWQKDPAATEVYRDWFLRLKEDPNCSAVADALNARKVPTGPYARRETWDGKMVRRLTRNPLLKGMPGRGFKHTVKHHESGRRVSVKNPEGPTFRECPLLAHVDPDLFDEVNRLLDEANEGFGRKPVDGIDPLRGRPKKRTCFPGQHAVCWYCGRTYVWGANGVAENLMCSGSREWRCWASVGFCGEAAGAAAAKALREELVRLKGFDDQFRALVDEAGRRGGADGDRRRAELDRAGAGLTTRRANLLDAITAYGPRPMFEGKLTELDAEERRLAAERRELERLCGCAPVLPGSVAELRQEFEGQFRDLAADSPEFGVLLRRLVPEFHVYLVRLCDGGHPLPRARATLSLSGVVPDARRAPGVTEFLTRTVTLDLFKTPQRERIRAEAVRLAGAGVDQRQIAARLPEPATQAGVWQALALDRRMRDLGLDTPYVMVSAPPSDYPKLRRHHNEKFVFEPLPDYRPPVL
jgi:site-specific DNA recombinase